MKHRLAAIVALSASAVALALPAAHAAPADDHHTTFTDDPGDAPSAVDIVKTSLRHSKGAYRADVTYTKLRKQKSDRWQITFLDFSPNRHAGDRGIIPTSGNVVELRVNPAGKQSSHGFVYSFGQNGPETTPSGCKGTIATPDYKASKIHFVIPNKCWLAMSGQVYVSVDARHYGDGEWDTTYQSVSATGGSSSPDQSTNVWNYGGQSN